MMNGGVQTCKQDNKNNKEDIINHGLIFSALDIL